MRRETGADLSCLQDIVGCRMVILGGLSELCRLQEEVCREWGGQVCKEGYSGVVEGVYC